MSPAKLRLILPHDDTAPPATASQGRALLSLLCPALVVALAAVALVTPDLTAAWELNRTAVADGQWWRLLTGHLTHWNLDHLFWDAATFFALAAVCMWRRPVTTVAAGFAGCLVISATVLTAHADLETYRGLSGLDTALFTLLATMIYQEARRNGDRALGAVAKWAGAALVAKTTYEVLTGATLFVDSEGAGFVPLASAHAAGAIVGFLAAITEPLIATLSAVWKAQPVQPTLACSPPRAILPLSRIAAFPRRWSGASGTRSQDGT
jgi:rhomboid family GlyGly-CTERM serine protease